MSLDAAEEQLDAVRKLHREEPGLARSRIYSALRRLREAASADERAAALDEMRAAKLAAEALAAVHAMERRVYQLDAKPWQRDKSGV